MFNKESIISLLEEYSDIVKEYKILKEDYSIDRYIFELKIVFKNNSKLENREVFLFINEIVKRRYKFQWMNQDNSLIIRWDNAPNHPNIKTHPYHLHRNEDNNIESSKEMTLKNVLEFIKNWLKEHIS